MCLKLNNSFIKKNLIYQRQYSRFCIISIFLLIFIWAIHTTLYRVCCIEYTWLFVNAQFYAVLCISHSKCIFLEFKQFNSTKPTLLLKNI